MTKADFAPTSELAGGRNTFVATVAAVFIALFLFLRDALTPRDWMILAALGLAYIAVCVYGVVRFEHSGSRQSLIPYFFLALLLGGAIIYWAVGFFLAGLILLPLASLGVQILSRRQSWVVNGLIMLTLVAVYGWEGGAEAAWLAGVSYLAALLFVVYITQTAVRERRARTEMERLTAQLEDANRKLQAYAAQAEELAVTRERARLAHELHDTVGHTLTALDVQLELLARLPPGQTEQRRRAAHHARALVKEGLADMRRAVAALRPAALESFSLPVAIDGLVAQFEHATAIPVDWKIEGEEANLAPRLALPLYRTVQEALTNIQRHAPTTPQVIIRLWYEPDAVRVSIVNARPSSEPQPSNAGSGGGQGLAGLRERAELLGGRFEAGPKKDGGFRVMMRLPLGS